MTDYGKKFVQGTIIVLFFSVLSTLLGFFVKALMARIIDVNLIGLFFSVLGFVTFFTFIRDLGLSDALLYFIPRFLVDNNKKDIKKVILLTLKVQIFFGLLFFILFSLFSKILAKYYFRDDSAIPLLIFLGFYFFLDGLHEVLLRIFHGYKKYVYLQGIDFMFQFLSSSFIILTLIFSKNIVFFGLSYILAEIFCIIFFFNIFLKKVFPDFLKLKIDSKTNNEKKFRKEIFNFSLPTMIATIGELSYAQQTIIFLTIFSGLESVGYYVMVNSLAKLSVFLYKATSRVFAPLISEMWKKKEYGQLNFYFKEHLVIVSVFAIPIISTMIFFPETILNLIYGEKFISIKNSLVIVSLSFFLQLINGLYSSSSIQIGKPQIYKKIVYLKVGINLVLNTLLIPDLGLFGAVISDFFSIFISTSYLIYLHFRLDIIKFPLREIFSLLFAGCGYILSILFLKILLKNLIINIIIKTVLIIMFSSIIYFIILIIFRIVSKRKINYFFENLK